MTDKGMAKKSFRDKELTYKVCRDERSYIEGFLAGLKIGRLKWHDLREDPNDLPKVNQEVLLQIKDEDEPITDFCRREGIWNFANKYEALAWCEIPKYEEVSK